MPPGGLIFIMGRFTSLLKPPPDGFIKYADSSTRSKSCRKSGKDRTYFMNFKAKFRSTAYLHPNQQVKIFSRQSPINLVDDLRFPQLGTRDPFMTELAEVGFFLFARHTSGFNQARNFPWVGAK